MFLSLHKQTPFCSSAGVMGDFSVFERSVRLDAPPAEVYAFHEDPRNITKISPPSLRVEQVECKVPARAGEKFSLRVHQFGLPLHWIGIWEEAVPNERLVDGARKSPFRHWRHHHLFRAEGDGTVMTDRVEYALPFGLIGLLLDLTVMRLVFTAMFIARHRATRRFFSP
jgi:hypothetical protein